MVDSQSTDELDSLRAAFAAELKQDRRTAAETAYALAFRYRNADVDGERRFDLAREWAARAVSLLDALPSASLDQIASSRGSVGGVPIPELLHSGVVHERLGDVLN